MRIIGQAAGVSLAVPNDAYLSFFNSPYAGHSRGTAVDVYPSEREWGWSVLSPVSGSIANIRKMSMGRAKPFETAEHDFAVGIKPEESDDLLVRIMHLTPSVRPGDPVDVGTVIGSTLRSRYFNYWTGPHFHAEVMALQDFHRSTMSIPLQVELGESVLRQESGTADNQEVLEVSEDCAMVDGSGLGVYQCGPYYGIPVATGEGKRVGILDAGVSHYGHGAIVGSDPIEDSEGVHLLGYGMGQIEWTRGDLHFFLRTKHLEFSLGGHTLRGLSTFLYPRKLLRKGVPPLVCIPHHYGGFGKHLEEGNVYDFRINSVKAM